MANNKDLFSPPTDDELKDTDMFLPPSDDELNMSSDEDKVSKAIDKSIDMLTEPALGGLAGKGIQVVGEGLPKLREMGKSSAEKLAASARDIDSNISTRDTIRKFAKQMNIEGADKLTTKDIGRRLLDRDLLAGSTEDIAEKLDISPDKESNYLKKVLKQYEKAPRGLTDTSTKGTLEYLYDKSKGKIASVLDSLSDLLPSGSSKLLKYAPKVGVAAGGLMSAAGALADTEAIGEGSDIVPEDVPMFKQSKQEMIEAANTLPKEQRDRILNKLNDNTRLTPTEKQQVSLSQNEKPVSTSSMYEASPEKLRSAANMSMEVLEPKEAERVSNVLNSMADANPQQRSAMLFSAMQNPSLRQSINKVMPDNE